MLGFGKVVRFSHIAMPFSILSVQVGGESEFMLHFEEDFKGLGITLYVLSSRRPQWNGSVERSKYLEERVLCEE